jgi:hypothetical protein
MRMMGHIPTGTSPQFTACVFTPSITPTMVDASTMEIYTSHVVVLIGTGIIMYSY